MSSRTIQADPTVTRWQAFNAVAAQTKRTCKEKTLAQMGIEAIL